MTFTIYGNTLHDVDGVTDGDVIFISADASHPLLHPNSTTLETRLSDDSAYTDHAALRFLTDSGTRIVDRTSDVKTTTTTIANDNTEQTVYTATIAADALVVGNVIDFDVGGQLSNDTAADDLTTNIYLGGELLATLNPAIGNVTNAVWHAGGHVVVRSLGAAGVVAVHLEVHIAGSSQEFIDLITVDTTDANDITVKVQWDNAKAANTISAYYGYTTFKN